MVRTGYKSWFDDRCVLPHRRKQRAYRVWSRSRSQADWEEHWVVRRHAQHVYVETERAFNEWSRVLLINAPNPRKWWSTVKTAVVGANSRLPPLLDKESRLVWSVDEKASLFSAHFEAKQCRDSFQQPHSCDPTPVLYSVAFRSSSLCSLLLDLDPYGGNDLDSVFLLFCKQVARELGSKLAVIFRHLVKRGSFLVCWRLADDVPVTKESPSSEFGDYRPITVTTLLSKVFEKIVAGKLSHFLESNSLLPPSQFWYHRGLVSCYALLTFTGCLGQGY